MADGGEDPQPVLQVERRDFTDLVPTDRPRAQPMRGFDPVYTDIVDYIVRCTHRIWDERDVGLIYTHYTHNAVIYSALGTLYDREDIVRDTIARLVAFPERRGMATQVIWGGDDERGFYTSHLVTSTGRHTQPGPYGRPTGRRFNTRTVADCMILANRIYREWIVSDTMATLRQLGVDPHPFALGIARAAHDRGLDALDLGETGRMLGQYPPPEQADTTLARTETEAALLRALHAMLNRRMFGEVRTLYAPTVLYHGPQMREMVGTQAVLHQWLGLIGSIPDAVFAPQHVCSVPSEEGGTKIAVRWIIDGHHLGHGILQALGEPSGAALHVMGMTHFHMRDGRVVEEWTIYDELSLLAQVKLAELAA